MQGSSKLGVVIRNNPHQVKIAANPYRPLSFAKWFNSERICIKGSHIGQVEAKVGRANASKMVSYVDDFQMFNSRIKALPDYSSVSGKLIQLSDYSQGWLQNNPEVKNFAHLSNKSLVLTSNGDQALEMMRADQAWVDSFVKNAGLATLDISVNKDQLFRILDVLADREKHGIINERRILNDLEYQFLRIAGTKDSKFIKVLDNSVNTAIRQQEGMNILNAAYGENIIKPLNCSLDLVLKSWRDMYLTECFPRRLLTLEDPVVKSGFGDGVAEWDNGRRALIEFKNWLYLDIIGFKSQIAFVEEINTKRIYKATFFDRFLTLDLPESVFYSHGFEFGKILKRYRLVDFIIVGTNIDSMVSRLTTFFELGEGVEIIAESDHAVVFEISEFQRMYNKIKNQSFVLLNKSTSKAMRQQEQYFKNLVAFRVGIKDGGSGEMELRRQSIIRKS